jgi:hypothetical protein
VQQHADMPPSKIDTPPAKDATQVAGANGGGPSGDVAGLLDALKQALAGLTALLGAGTLAGGPGGKDDPAQKGVEQIGQVPPGKVGGEHGEACDMPGMELPPGKDDGLVVQEPPTKVDAANGDSAGSVSPAQKGEDPTQGGGPTQKGEDPGQVGGLHGGKPGWGHGGFGPPGKFGFPGQFFPGQHPHPLPHEPAQKGAPSKVGGTKGSGLEDQLHQGLLELQQLGLDISPDQSGPGPKGKIDIQQTNSGPTPATLAGATFASELPPAVPSDSLSSSTTS